MKVVINACYGGFSLSHKANMRYAELKGMKIYPYRHSYKDDTVTLIESEDDVKSVFTIHYTTKPIKSLEELNDHYFEGGRGLERTDETLIKVVEEMGEEANGPHAKLRIIYIPDGVEYEIDEYDGIESIHEKHRSWG